MDIFVGRTLQGRWKITAKLCRGSYAQIYLAEDIVTRTECAVKVDDPWWITDEKKIYDVLNSDSSTPNLTSGISRLIGHGYEKSEAFLVLQKLGASIHQLWVICHKKFTHPTIAKIAIQVLRRLKFVHERGIVHGDISAKNLVLGSRGEEKTIYLIDYGQGKKFDVEEVHDRGNFSPSGEGEAGSCPRDDLMGMMRMLIRLHRGKSHAWLRASKPKEPEGFTKRVMRKLSLLGKVKDEKAEGNDLWHYWECTKYIDVLDSKEKPDYGLLIGIFKDYLNRIKDRDERMFQWMDVNLYCSLKE